ncbi:MAG: hypothetical protein M3487_02015 [Actinomycetota bacterium]|nr:hypothetical protein [Acidimicrobiia bacterium]MDQ3468542.1 hypothetical protein [Actinomycetota bacterium]
MTVTDTADGLGAVPTPISFQPGDEQQVVSIPVALNENPDNESRSS